MAVEYGHGGGHDRGVTNSTVVYKTDGNYTDILCCDTATSFRANKSWNDGMRLAISHQNKHSQFARMIQQRIAYNRDMANAPDYAEWLLARKACHDADIVCFEDLDIEAMTRRGNAAKRGLNRKCASYATV